MDLNFLTSGVVSEVLVKAGDKVTAGQVVGRLDPTDADAKVASAQAALVTSQDNLAKAQTTYSDDVAAYLATSDPGRDCLPGAQGGQGEPGQLPGRAELGRQGPFATTT